MVSALSAGLAIFAGLACSGAQAADSMPKGDDESLRIVIKGDLCKRLTDHVPAADVRYKPGVDVKGRPVAAAEVGGGKPAFLPSTIEFPVTVDVFERVGQVVPPGTDGKLTLGTVRLDGNKVMFNGINIGSSEDVYMACAGVRMR
jgi:hypothetical protein